MQILQNHQQPDPQVFDHFGIGGFIGFAALVGLKTDLSDLGRIAQKFPAVCGQRAIPIRPPQPQSVEQTLAPGAQRIGSLIQGRVIVGQQGGHGAVIGVQLGSAKLQQFGKEVANRFGQFGALNQFLARHSQPAVAVKRGIGAEETA